jgi:DNA (cytosine-5)-methyltransferase 1
MPLITSPHAYTWNNFNFIDLFAGIGGIRMAFEYVGGHCVWSSEWDPAAQDTYEANFGERPCGDITQIPPSEIPDHDILLGGFPCQAFSIIGSMQGFADTRGTLFFNVEAILREKKPPAFMLENVKQLRSHDGGRTFSVIIQHLEALGYHVHSTVLNALDFGLPQKRERTFIVGFLNDIEFNFPKPTGEKPDLTQILERDEDVDPKLRASQKILEDRRKRVNGKIIPYPSIWHENKGGNVSPLPYSCALRTGASYNYLLVNGVRRPSSRELLRLQGFPEDFKVVVSHAEVRRQTGNSVAVPVVRAVASKIIEALKEDRPRIGRPVQQMLIEVRDETDRREGLSG